MPLAVHKKNSQGLGVIFSMRRWGWNLPPPSAIMSMYRESNFFSEKLGHRISIPYYSFGHPNAPEHGIVNNYAWSSHTRKNWPALLSLYVEYTASSRIKILRENTHTYKVDLSTESINN